MHTVETIRLEKDLCEPLRNFWIARGFDVRSEVNGCDMVASRDDLFVVIEMKRHLSFDLLAQAVDRQRFADHVYAAVPKPDPFREDKAWKEKLRVLRRLGLGLLLVSKSGDVLFAEEALLPMTPSEISLSSPKRKSLEAEFRKRSLDLNVGGTRGVPLVTAYRETALRIAHILRANEPLSQKELREHGADKKKTSGILTANHYGWFARDEAKKYRLTAAGHDALLQYADLVRTFPSVTSEILPQGGASPKGEISPVSDRVTSP